MSNDFMVLCLSLVLLTGCGTNEKEGPNINSTVKELSEENSERVNSPSGHSTSYERLLEDGKAVDIAGATFSAGDLKKDLSGQTFYPTRRSGIIEFLDDERVQIKSPSGENFSGNYKVINSKNILRLTINYQGSEKTCNYEISRSENLAMLKLEEYSEEDKPFPLVAKAKL